jgi:hypothetical protein
VEEVAVQEIRFAFGENSPEGAIDSRGRQERERPERQAIEGHAVRDERAFEALFDRRDGAHRGLVAGALEISAQIEEVVLGASRLEGADEVENTVAIHESGRLR